MEKRAVTEVEIHDLLVRRWSPRAFDPKPVPADVLARMFEGARWAASSYNEQPWRYLVGVKAENPEQFDRLSSVLLPFNGWAKTAPVLAMSIAKNTFSHDGSPNRVALHDVGAASASLALQAVSDNVLIHQMGGFDAAKAKEVFHIPEGFDPVAMLAIGYLGDPESLDPTLKARELSERKRKKVSEFVSFGDFAQITGS